VGSGRLRAGELSATERPQVPTICEMAADATELLVEVGLEPAQNQVHAW
jgi:PTH1 family peptidyl-tRNA hydrolase